MTQVYCVVRGGCVCVWGGIPSLLVPCCGTLKYIVPIILCMHDGEDVVCLDYQVGAKRYWEKGCEVMGEG